MSQQTPEEPAVNPHSRELHGRLELANRLYREFQNQCFWHSPLDLVITEDLLPFVVKGLRTHGGHRGFKLTAKLLPGAKMKPDVSLWE